MTRTVLITGATDGLGLGVAEQIAAAGHRAILHGRNAERLANAAAAVEQRCGIRPNTVVGDLSRQAEIAGLVDQVHGLTDQLDVLINNAGLGPGRPGEARQESADGFELRLAVNFLAPVALTLGLLPVLRRGTHPRIVHVASDGQAPVDFDNLMLTRNYSGEQAYCQSKLALITFGLTLAELTDAGVLNVHPGSAMPTKMVREMEIATKDDLQGGIDAVTRLALDPAYAGVTGKYFVRLREEQALDPAYDPDYRDRLWGEALRLTGASL